MRICSHQQLEVFQLAFAAAAEIFTLSKEFPKHEQYSLTDQIRRSSRSVCANIAEAFRRRRYEGSFVLRLNDAEGEVAETQVWLTFALECKYMQAETARKLIERYETIIGKLVSMINHPEHWKL